ncbi:FKBP-type peptidyl-prolyl cis-trans isomerase [Sphingomonas rhizophila]|uniref:Peptidyl-prolyl cis-trans isomerase n=1 Tax=Sphingomonas rhizophila TaxID=2071607 RepID=A0A7G9SAZ3_9SPHN|nr:FKBP-type peptidyl-prolyl cis-trans isomerase [Sphingomonas rhizophila]QNN65018.1 FKBP-type peptidyl-prolyl cis-trans isomerase [Sphingomonas rhizophila]
MTVTQVPLRPIARGSLVKLWLAIALLVIAAFALARFGTSSFQFETTASGIQFRTIAPGTGDRIKAVDGVYLEYDGRLPDGKVFDSTQGKPVPMIPQQVIPGFSEALQMMQKGGQYTVRIPAALGYGANVPPGGPIPPNSDLIFDVKIIEVIPNAALMQQQGPPPGAMPPGQ